MLKVLIVGQGKETRKPVLTGLVKVCAEIEIHQQNPLDSEASNSLDTGYDAVFLHNSEIDDWEKQLEQIRESLHARSVILYGGKKSGLIKKRISDSIIDVHLSEAEMKKTNGTRFINIKDILQAKDASSHSRIEEEYRRIDQSSSSALDAVMVTDIEGKVTYANKALMSMFGFHSSEEVIGRPILEEFGSMGNADLLLGELGKGGGWHGELAITNSEGKAIYTNLFASLAEEIGGNPTRVIYSFRDVTAQKLAEEKLKRANMALKVIRKCTSVIMNSSNDSELIENVCKVIVESADYPLAWVGYVVKEDETDIVPVAAASDDETLKESLGSSWIGNDELCKPLGRCIKLKEPVVINDVSTLKSCCEFGKKIYRAGISSILCFPLKEKNRVFGVLTICSHEEGEFEEEEVVSLSEMADDMAYAISALRVQIMHENMELALRRLRGVSQERIKVISELSKVLEAFDYSVTNALKVPLRYIEGYTELLTEKYSGELGEEGSRYLAVIKKSVLSVNKITDNLSMLSRATNQEVEFEDLDLSIIANSIAANLAEIDTSRQVKFYVKDKMRCKASLHLFTVLMEILFDNAWKGTELSDAAAIEFGLLEMENNKVFYVKDNGCGFDPARARRIFTPFHSFHTDGTFEGTGLGLATAERIVKRHGGKIWADGEVDKGATIYFTLS